MDQPLPETPESPFCKSIPHLHRVFDSGMMRDLKDCPRKFYYRYVLGYQPVGDRHPLIFGIWVHKALETFDVRQAAGDDYKTALRAAIRFCLEASTTYEEEEACTGCGGHKGEPTDIVCGQCGSSSWESVRRPIFYPGDGKTRNRFTLVRTIVWYCEHYKNDVLETLILPNGEPALELAFHLSLPLLSPDGDPYLYVGHIDRLVREKPHGTAAVVDRKHTATTISDQYFRKYAPDNQMSGYLTGAKVFTGEPVKRVIIDAAQVAGSFTRFARGYAPRTEAFLDEWIKDLTYYIGQAEKFAKDGYWPQNDLACHHYGKCEFRDDVCSRCPSVRDRWLNDKSKFTKVSWNPLKSRDA